VTACVGMRGDAGQVKSSACHVVANILKCSKIYFQGVTTCHDETVKCTVTRFVNSSQLMRDRWHDITQTMRHLAALTNFVILQVALLLQRGPAMLCVRQ